jgi:hypothetical protein
MSLHDVLRINLKAFDHMLEELGKTYAEFILNVGDDRFRLNLAYLFSDAYAPQPVLDGGGRPYEPEVAKQVLVATALDIPISTLDEVKAGGRNEFFFSAWKELKRIYWSRDWYNRETFALRMRPMLEGSRKSLEGFWLERAVRESMARVAEQIGLTIDPKGDKPRRMKNRNVITLRSADDSRGHSGVIRVQVKGVNSSRHHPERAKILAKFADDVVQDGDLALPILVGECGEVYRDIPALQYIRVEPQHVIGMGENLDLVLSEMVCRLL